MCCDWFDLLVAAAGGFFLGCTVTAFLAKKIVLEQAELHGNLLQRTELKNRNIEWK